MPLQPSNVDRPHVIARISPAQRSNMQFQIWRTESSSLALQPFAKSPWITLCVRTERCAELTGPSIGRRPPPHTNTHHTHTHRHSRSRRAWLRRSTPRAEQKLYFLLESPIRFSLLLKRGIVQSTVVYSELCLPVCKTRPIAHLYRPTANRTHHR